MLSRAHPPVQVQAGGEVPSSPGLGWEGQTLNKTRTGPMTGQLGTQPPGRTKDGTVGTPPPGEQATPRAVRLFRSRRRTFLLLLLLFIKLEESRRRDNRSQTVDDLQKLCRFDAGL